MRTCRLLPCYKKIKSATTEAAAQKAQTPVVAKLIQYNKH